MTWTRSIAVWLLIMLAESVHGVLRTLLLAPMIGDFRARQVSVFTGAAIIFAISFATIRWINARRSAALLRIGFVWVLLTITFEVLLGRFIMELDWSRILTDYDLTQGGLMGIGLLAMWFTPIVTAKIRGLAA